MAGMDNGMLEAMMRDPEIMAILSKPGIMAKFQALAANPAAAMQYANDPDIQTILAKLQNMGAAPSSSSTSTTSSNDTVNAGTVNHIQSAQQFNTILNTYHKQLIVVDFYAEWCGPCKMIAPTLQSLASVYKQVVFLKVDGDKNKALVMMKKIEAYPTFHFYKNGALLEEMRGADASKLENLVARYADVEESKELTSPYKNFPLKEEEAVKYDTIKWNIVESKIEEFSAKLEGDQKLEDVEISLMRSLCDTLAKRDEYIQSKIEQDEFDVICNKLLTWPEKSLPPVLNLLRAAVFHPAFGDRVIRSEVFLSNLLKTIASPDSLELNITQVLQLFCNCLTRRALTIWALEKSEDILNSTAILAKSENKKVKQAYACFLLNYSIGLLYRKKSLKNESESSIDFVNAKLQCLSSAVELLSGEQSASAVYRLLVIIGTLVYRDEESKTVASTIDLENMLDGFMTSAELKEDANIKSICLELKKSLSGDA